MKQFLRWGVLATALMVMTGSAAFAQGPGVPATKVGVVNIGLLFTKYLKAQTFKKELEADLAPLKADAEKLKNAMLAHKKCLDSGAGATNAAQKDVSEKALRDGQRQLEDLDLQARKLIGKKQETQLIQLYKEIQAAVQSYGAQSGYHAIFAYGDPPDQDLFSFTNINRKMQGMDMGALVPFYIQPGLDVSNDVLARLNAPFGGTPPAPVQGIPTSNPKQ